MCDISYLHLIIIQKNTSPENWSKCTYDLVAFSRRLSSPNNFSLAKWEDASPLQPPPGASLLDLCVSLTQFLQSYLENLPKPILTKISDQHWWLFLLYINISVMFHLPLQGTGDTKHHKLEAQISRSATFVGLPYPILSGESIQINF